MGKVTIHYYPLVMTNIAIENGPFIVDFPIENGDIFHSFLYVYQRVTLFITIPFFRDFDSSIFYGF